MHLLIPPQVEWALTLWSTLTITASSIEDKLPTTMKKVNPNNKLELTRSTLFNEVAWGVAMSSYILSCGNIKPEGWIAIEKEALAFVKVNSRCNVSVFA